jgi:hypothetical protein
VDERPGEAAVLDQDLVAVRARVGPGARALEHDGALLRLGDAQPEGEREVLPVRELGHAGEGRVVVAVEAQRLAQPAGNELGRVEQRAGLGCVDGVLEPAIGQRIQREARRGRGQRELGPARAPGVELGAARRTQLDRSALEFLHLRAQPLDLGRLLLGRQGQRRRGCRRREVRVQPALVHVVEVGEQAVVVVLRDGVVLVVVAARALEREPEESRAEGVHAVGHVLDAVFLLDAATLVGLAVQAVEGRGQALVARGAGQQVAGELGAQEAVVGQVFVERADQPVAPGPDGALGVGLVAVGVGVARQVEPGGGHALAEARVGEQALDEALVGVAGALGEEEVDLCARRRQAGQVERDAPDQRLALGLRARRQALGLQARQHEAVDRVPAPGLVAQRGQARAARRHEGPVRRVLGPRGDPAAQQLALLRGQRRLLRLRRRHALVGIRAGDAREQQALRRRAGNDREARLARGRRAREGVEAQLRLARARVGAVAGEAALGQERADLAREIGRARAPLGACRLTRGSRAQGGRQRGRQDGRRQEPERRGMEADLRHGRVPPTLSCLGLSRPRSRGANRVAPGLVQGPGRPRRGSPPRSNVGWTHPLSGGSA